MIGVYTRIRAVIGLVLATLDTLLFSILVLIAGLLDRQRLATKLISFWSDMVFRLFGIEVQTDGEENLPAVGGGIVVFNHQSHLDIPALCASTNKQIRFGAKVELFRIPFFGPAMRSIGTLPIARENRSEVMRIYEDAARRFQEGILFILAPEGTRQSQPAIGRFKKGPFIFAINAKVPIIPAVIYGAFEALPKRTLLINVGRFRRAIRIRYLKPIDTTTLSLQEVDSLVEETRRQFVETFDQLKHQTSN